MPELLNIQTQFVQLFALSKAMGLDQKEEDIHVDLIELEKMFEGNARIYDLCRKILIGISKLTNQQTHIKSQNLLK